MPNRPFGRFGEHPLSDGKRTMRFMKRLLTVLGGSGAGNGITVLLEDAPIVAIAAGSLNGTLATDSINVRTVTDTTNKLVTTVANGFEFTGVSAQGNPGLWYPSIARQGGLAVATRIKPVSGTIQHRAGIDSDQTGDILDGIYASLGGLNAFFVGSARTILNGVYVVGASYDAITIYRSTGGSWIYIKGDVFTDWKLAFVYNAGTTSPINPAAIARAAGSGVFYMKKIKAGLLSQFVGQYANVTTRLAVTVANDTINAALGDALIEHTIVAATGVTQELMVRRTDDNNCIIIRMDFTGATIKVYEKNAGVEVEKTGGTTAMTWVNGTSYRILVSLYGSDIRVTVGLAGKNDASSAFNASVTGVKVSHAGTDLIAWPLDPPAGALAQLNAFFQ